MKTMIGSIAAGLFLVALVMGCGGGGGGGDDGGNGRETPETAAQEIADAVITSDYPELVGVAPEYQTYGSGGRQFHEFIYMRTIEVVSDGAMIEIPHNVVVSVDQGTGETEIYESN